MKPVEQIEEYLVEKERLEKAATEGPWELADCHDGIYAGARCLIRAAAGNEIFGPRQLGRLQDQNVEKNASLLVHARNNASREIQAMRLLVEALEAFATGTSTTKEWVNGTKWFQGTVSGAVAGEALEKAARILGGGE